MKIWKNLSLAFAMMVVLACIAIPAFAADTITLPITVEEDYTRAQELLSLINERRHELGVMNDLQMDEKLQDIAMQRAAELVVSFSHDRPLGRSILGEYPDIRGENIAEGQGLAKVVFNDWKGSTLHGPTMNSRDSNYCGIGCVLYEGTRYWVLETYATAMSTVTTTTGVKQAQRTVDVDVSKIKFKAWTWTSPFEGIEKYLNTTGPYFGYDTQAGISIMNFDPDDVGMGYVCDPSMLTFSANTPDVFTVTPGGILSPKKVGTGSMTVALKARPEIKGDVSVTIQTNILNVWNKSMSYEINGGTTFDYTGSAITPGMTIKDIFGNTLAEGTDYVLEYSNNVNPGMAGINIYTAGNYAYMGAKTLYDTAYFMIAAPPETETEAPAGGEDKNTGQGSNTGGGKNPSKTPEGGTVEDGIQAPAPVSVSKLVSKSRHKLTVKWKKKAGVSGYQIQYALNKKFTKGKKTKKAAGYKKTSLTVAKLHSGKVYYARIRTYKKVNGKTYYSKWSKAKKIRVK